MRFVYAGRLEETKGVGVLLQAAEAAHQQADFTLTVVGKGSAEEALRARYGHHPWIHFTGHVTMQEAIDHIAGGDMLCIPSIWLENSPGVVIQALGMSVPVISSNVGGLPELVHHDENGLLVPPGDVKAWEDALLMVLSDKGRLARYQDNAAQRAGEFDQDHIGRRYLQFIEQIRAFKPAARAAS